MKSHIEKHIKIGNYLKDIIFAANDGIVTTFAVVAGVVGASLSHEIILIIGFASLFADAFSMATGNYLGTKTEQDFYNKESAEEAKEIEETPENELNEVREILRNKGYVGADVERMTELISSNKTYWRDFMLHEEIGIISPEKGSAFKNGLVTFISFLMAGSIILIPYIFLNGDYAFQISILVGIITLFSVGALRKFFSDRSWFVSGLEMLIVGGSAAILAYLIGSFLGGIIG
ncbi:MAG TPA: VIT1/CCC1 transporter family protein [Candidatus Paceibacterota bacterium]